ncbi:MAG: alpha/beta hydrolase [Acidobacteria bacterium]|jgi:pimeloyl-ACP methyl ester carboxylesterase|nr:alpha/beta hydrolase [Acidobacteriota bacterium]
MRERAVVFGEGNILSGVVTEPGDGASRTGVLLFNSGILHRIGPGRLHVRLARALAEAGIPTLRFDFSGLGESEARSDAVSYEERTVREAQAAMDVLAQDGAERFVVFGICSGADNGLRVALAEPRVAGAALVALYTFGSRAFAVDRYFRQILTLEFWKRAASGGVDVVSTVRNYLKRKRKPAAPVAEAGDEAQFWKMPPADRIVADFRSLTARGVELLLVYSRRSPAEFNYRSVLRREVKALPAGASVRVEMFAGSDHTLTPRAHQARLIDLVVECARRVDARTSDAPGREVMAS